MLPLFWHIPVAAMLEGLFIGLVLVILGTIGIWAAAELVKLAVANWGEGSRGVRLHDKHSAS